MFSISSPSLDFGSRDWDQVLKGWSKNFRRNSGKAARRVERDFEAEWRLATPQSVDADLEILIELHRARWGDESGAFEGFWGELHRRFVPVAAEAGWLRLLVLELDGRPAAAYYNLRYGRAEMAYQYGRDPELGRYDLGTLCDLHGMRSALEDGLDEYRFLRGPESYKDRFATRDDPVETVVVPLKVRARALPPLLRNVERLPRPLRRRLDRFVECLVPATPLLYDFSIQGSIFYGTALGI